MGWRARWPSWQPIKPAATVVALGPIVPQSNPILLAEEMAMLDTMAEGRLIVGMLRGTTNEILAYDSTRRNRASAPTRAWS